MDFNWKEPDYDPVWKDRRDRTINLSKMDQGAMDGLFEYYADNPVAFINDWGCTFDPRNPERDLPALIPFLLFPRQEEFINWLYARWKGSEDGLTEKSRDMGVSWLCVAFACWMWIFHPGSVIGFGSRKEELVDKLGDPKSLFWKAREFIKYLPPQFRPNDWSERAHAPYMRIMNKDNGSSIVGEAGDNIGRGNRTSIYFKDESAFYDKPESIDAALSQTSNCKIDVSTPNGNGNPFYRKRMGGQIPVFTFHWHEDPRKDDEWYRKQVATLDKVIVAQEIDLDYNASVANVFIDGQLIIDAQNMSAMDIEANGPWMVGIDAAHEGNDESVIHARRGRFNADQVIIAGKTNGPQLASAIEEYLDTIVHEKAPLGQIVIELDGPGISCYDQLKLGKYSKFVVGIHTGARLSDNKHYNRRAKLWSDANEYLREGGVLMPRDPELKSQIASMQYTYKDGVLLMQAKKEYKSSYGRSCDRADAFILTFNPYNPRVYSKENDPYAHDYDGNHSWMSM
jgi:hypothetical protein